MRRNNIFSFSWHARAHCDNAGVVALREVGNPFLLPRGLCQLLTALSVETGKERVEGW